jgi:hypothetical protein
MWTIKVVFPNGHISARAFYVIDDAYRYATHNVDRTRVKRIILNHCVTGDRRTLFDVDWTLESNIASLKMPA